MLMQNASLGNPSVYRNLFKSSFSIKSINNLNNDDGIFKGLKTMLPQSIIRITKGY